MEWHPTRHPQRTDEYKSFGDLLELALSPKTHTTLVMARRRDHADHSHNYRHRRRRRRRERERDEHMTVAQAVQLGLRWLLSAGCVVVVCLSIAILAAIAVRRGIAAAMQPFLDRAIAAVAPFSAASQSVVTAATASSLDPLSPSLSATPTSASSSTSTTAATIEGYYAGTTGVPSSQTPGSFDPRHAGINLGVGRSGFVGGTPSGRGKGQLGQGHSSRRKQPTST